MTIQDDVKAARRAGMSRKALAELSGLTEGKIWRIENKGNVSQDEIDMLQPVIERVLRGETLTPKPKPKTTAQVIDEAFPLPSDVAPKPIDWTTLQKLASQVGDHELERVLEGPDPTKGRLISNSEVQTFKRCRRKWWLAYYRKLKMRYESPLGARAIGDRIHRALKMYYTPNPRNAVDPRNALEHLITSDWTKISLQLSDDPLKLQSIEKKFNDEANLERAMIEGYVQWLAETGADADLQTVSSERYIEANITELLESLGPLNEGSVFLIGKLDEQVVRMSDGVRLFKDHKTVADFIAPRATVTGDEQMLTYHLLEFLNTSDADERCDGALYNMLRKVKRTGNAKPPFYDRIEVHHNAHTLENFKTRLMGTIDDMLTVERDLNEGVHHMSVAYPRWTRDCRWDCDFFSVCTMFDDGSRVEDALAQWYRIGDPLDYYRTDIDEGTIEGGF